MPNVIEVSGLHKSFGKFPALNGVDLTVAQGQVHGYLGPNGPASPQRSVCSWAC
ncbi:ABC-2 type transport system ATP-binding protein [Ruaniaceae bacterium KH17]|nr:ABC-2 type transport system ATP-binding protein [Ruaniaceae bacterium KH17]